MSQNSFGKGSIGQNSFGKASIGCNSSYRYDFVYTFWRLHCFYPPSYYSPVLSNGSKNGTLKKNKPTTPTSPTPSNADSQLDFLLKSLAKETLTGIQRDESRNESSKLEGKISLYLKRLDLEACSIIKSEDVVDSYILIYPYCDWLKYLWYIIQIVFRK